MIHRFWKWVKGMTAQRSVRTTICDLPEEFGERMRLDEVRGYFLDGRNAKVIHAVVQVLWMHRRAVDKEARDCAALRDREGGAAFYLGGMDLVDGVIADVQLLMDAERPPDAEMRRWFKPPVAGGGSPEGD
jgi:hypothetical protein